MVAPPNDVTYSWGDVQVVEATDGVLIDRGTIQSLGEGNPYIDWRLWRWENGEYVSDTPESDPFQVMETYKGYWVNVKQSGVLLQFDPLLLPSFIGEPETLVAKAWHKTRTWLADLNIFSKEAVAVDNDTPPMPMGGLDSNDVEPVFQGCFIEITGDFDRF